MTFVGSTRNAGRLAERRMEVPLFSFEGAPPSLSWEKNAGEREIRAFFAYFLSRKKVCAFSSVGRATDS